MESVLQIRKYLAQFPPMPPLSLNEATILHVLSYILQDSVALLGQLYLLRLNFGQGGPGYAFVDLLEKDAAVYGVASGVGVVILLVGLGIYFSRAADRKKVDENSEMSWEYLLAAFGMGCLSGLRWVTELLPLCLSATVLLTSCGATGHCLSEGWLYGLYAVQALLILVEFWLVNIVLQNYNDRKDFSMCGNPACQTLHKYVVVACAVANPLVVEGRFAGLLVALLHGALFLLLFWYFCRRGLNLVETERLRYLFIFHLLTNIALGLAFALANMALLIDPAAPSHPLQPTFAITILPVLLAGGSYFLYCHCEVISSQVEGPLLRVKADLLSEIIQGSANSLNLDALVRGLTLRHLDSQCSNPACFSLRQELVDCKKKKSFGPGRIAQCKSSFVKLLLKCEYEKELAANNAPQVRLSFAEFLYKKLRVAGQALLILRGLEHEVLDLSEMIRAKRLVDLVRRQSEKLNAEIYQEGLQIEQLINLEEQFSLIAGRCKEVLAARAEFWALVDQQEIDLDELQQVAEESLQPFPEINQRWAQFAKYFEQHRKWNFYYAWYLQFVANEKLKVSMVEALNGEQGAFQALSFFSESCSVVEVRSERAVISNVSNNFEQHFGYSKEEVVRKLEVKELLPGLLREHHGAVIREWEDAGQFTVAGKFRELEVVAVHKNGKVLRCRKFLKMVVGAAGISYVVMLARSPEAEKFILLDEHFDMQGMTGEAFRFLQLHKHIEEPSALLGASVFLLYPKLIEYTHHRKFLNHSQAGIFGVKQVRKRGNELKLADTVRKLALTAQVSHEFKKYLRQYKGLSAFRFESEGSKQRVELLCTIWADHVRDVECTQIRTEVSLAEQKCLGLTYYVLSLESLTPEEGKRQPKREEEHLEEERTRLMAVPNIFLKEDNNQPTRELPNLNYISYFFNVKAFLAFLLLLLYLVAVVLPSHAVIYRRAGLETNAQTWLNEIYSNNNAFLTLRLLQQRGILSDELLAGLKQTIARSQKRVTQPSFLYVFEDLLYDDWVFPPFWYFLGGNRISEIELSEIYLHSTNTKAFQPFTDSKHFAESMNLSVGFLWEQNRLFQLANDLSYSLSRDLLDTVLSWDYAYLAIFLLLAVLGFLASCHLINGVTDSFSSVLESFQCIRPEDVRGIRRYQTSLQSTFQQFYRLTPEVGAAGQESGGSEEESNHLFLNKKIKSTRGTERIERIRTRSICFLSLLILLFVLLSLGLLLAYTLTLTSALNYFATYPLLQSTGYHVPKYVFTALARALREPVIEPFLAGSLAFPINLSSEINFINTLSFDVSYFDEAAVDRLLFRNACANLTRYNCSAVGQQIFGHGLSSLLQLLVTFWQPAYQGLGPVQNAQLATIVPVLLVQHELFEELQLAWLAGVLRRLQVSQNVFIIGAGVLFLVLSLVALRLLLRVAVLGHLHENYEFYIQIYKHFMPDESVNKEKIVKAKLIINGILKK